MGGAELRTRALTALVALAGGDRWSDRVTAGVALAAFAADPQAETALGALLDDDDEAVIEETAQALLRRHDRAGIQLIAAAIGEGYLDDAVAAQVYRVLNVFAGERDEALAHCDALCAELPRCPTRSGAETLGDLLRALDPPMKPAPRL